RVKPARVSEESAFLRDSEREVVAEDPAQLTTFRVRKDGTEPICISVVHIDSRPPHHPSGHVVPVMLEMRQNGTVNDQHVCITTALLNSAELPVEYDHAVSGVS